MALALPHRIETARLVLRVLEPTDAPAWGALRDRSRAHLLPWIPGIQAETTAPDDRLRQVLRMRSRHHTGPAHEYGCFLRSGTASDAEGELVGMVGAYDLGRPDAVDLGWWLAPDATGRGLAREAVAALVEVLLRRRCVGLLHASVDPANAPSRALAERLGFRPAATLRRNFRRADGSPTDTLRYELPVEAFEPAAAGPALFDALGRPLALDLPAEAARPRGPVAPAPDHVPPGSRPLAYRIETERLVIRCYEPADAAAVQEVCARSRAHLLAFMPWAEDDPQTLDEKLELLLGFRARYHGGDGVVGLFTHAGELVGGAGWHPRCGPGGQELGYWIAPEREGQGLVTEAVRALVATVFRRRLADRIVICCAPENARSRAIPARLGFVEEGLLRRSFQWRDGAPRDTVRYSLLDTEYPDSPAAGLEPRLFDALGRELPLDAPA